MELERDQGDSIEEPEVSAEDGPSGLSEKGLRSGSNSLSRATLRDVAARAGVHAATASRALNPETTSLVNAATAKRVREAAALLGYRPNPMALGLKTRRSLTIGVLVPDLTNPLFPPIVRGIEDAIGTSGYTAVLANSDNDPEKERLHFENMRSRQVEGFIMATAQTDQPLIQDAIAAGAPIVLVNRTVQSNKTFAVVGNERLGAGLAVRHLLQMGHKRIAHLVGPKRFSTAVSRYEGYVETLSSERFSVDAALVRFGESFTEAEGYRLFNELLADETEFTAVFAGNDLLAMGCYDAMRDADLRCPQDISIVGYNDLPFLNKLNPPLTSVRVPHYQMGFEAGKLLLERLTEPTSRPRTLVLEPELVVRKSTAPPEG